MLKYNKVNLMKKIIYCIAGIGILLDQITKLLVSIYLEHIEVISNFFSLTYVENKGAAWGILNNSTIILVGISVVVLLMISKYISSTIEFTKLSVVSYGLLIGGIFGNLIDRIFRGYVIDFLNFNILGYHFPVFNIADTMIVIGVILMFIEVIGDTYGNKSRKK